MVILKLSIQIKNRSICVLITHLKKKKKKKKCCKNDDYFAPVVETQEKPVLPVYGGTRTADMLVWGL